MGKVQYRIDVQIKMKKTNVGGVAAMKEMVKCMAELKQELKDFKEEIIPRLERIEQQTIKTNGRVNTHDTDLQLIKQRETDCPAKKFVIEFKEERKQIQDLSYKKITAIVGITAVVVSVINLMFSYLG